MEREFTSTEIAELSGWTAAEINLMVSEKLIAPARPSEKKGKPAGYSQANALTLIMLKLLTTATPRFDARARLLEVARCIALEGSDEDIIALTPNGVKRFAKGDSVALIRKRLEGQTACFYDVAYFRNLLADKLDAGDDAEAAEV